MLMEVCNLCVSGIPLFMRFLGILCHTPFLSRDVTIACKRLQNLAWTSTMDEI